MAAAEPYPGQDLEALSENPRYYRWIVRSFGAFLHGRVVELGAGIGNFSAHYVSLVSEAVLIEPDARLHDELARRFAGTGHVRVVKGYLEEATIGSSGLQAGSFDAAVAVNVLEHIADDARAVQLLAGLLRPGGVLLVFVPALPGLYGSLDRVFHHHRRYTRAGLAAVARSSGLEVVELRYFDSFGIVPWWLMGRLLRLRTFSRRGAELYDRFVVPLLSRCEARVRPIIGKNLVCIARKPAA